MGLLCRRERLVDRRLGIWSRPMRTRREYHCNSAQAHIRSNLNS